MTPISLRSSLMSPFNLRLGISIGIFGLGLLVKIWKAFPVRCIQNNILVQNQDGQMMSVFHCYIGI